MKAAGLNRVDQRPKSSHFAHTDAAAAAVPGLEMAGVVEIVGPNVRRYKIGDRVMGMVQGACATHARLHEDLAMSVPANMSWETAAAIPVSYLTAYDALVTRGRLTQGGSALIHAVTSGVGQAGLQLAKLRGASVILGSSSSESKLAEATGDGLTVGLLDPYAGFAEQVLAATDGRGVDVVLDNISGALLNETVAATRYEGRIIGVGRLGGTRADIDLDLIAVRRVSLVGVTFRTRTRDEHAAVCGAFLADHADDLAAGRLSPRIAKVFPFEELPQAISFGKAATVYGKVVLTMSSL